VSPPPPPTDETLAAGVAVGDGAALHALHLRYAGRTRRFLERLTRDPELARDLTQETFTRVWLRADTFDVEGRRFRGWLFTIALNLARSALARRRRAVLGVDREVVEARPSEVESPYARLARSEDEGRLARAVSRLAPSLREVVVLRIYRQLRFAEIAALTGTPESALRLRFHRAVQHLRQRLNPPAAAAGRSVSARYTAAHAAAGREHRPRGHRAAGPAGA
jgi:RNA polymerase sigma-70 factor, ECF subfamily